jgi:hypothetical protein
VVGYRATLTTIVFVVPPTIYAWYVLEVWIGAAEVSRAKVMRDSGMSPESARWTAPTVSPAS